MRGSARRQPTAFERALSIGMGLAVSLLSWPAEDEMRRHLSTLGLPRLLLVDAEAPPPELLDAHEDWVRLPTDPADLQARAAQLLERAAPAGETPVAPELDGDGLLHVGSAWVAIPAGQLPLVRLLLDNRDRVVRTDAIAAACVAAGGSGHPASVRTLLGRLGGRLRGVGLELVTVRQRGVLLRLAQPPPGAGWPA